MASAHWEGHKSGRIGWLRAAVLGANDGIISVASLVVGVASSGAAKSTVLLTGVAGTVAGAISMAAGEYVSVQSQADTEEADLTRERRELATEPARELDELASIYASRGLDRELAVKVAEQLTARDALTAHAREELGITDMARARPLQASVASAAAFAAGSVVPIVTVVLSPPASVGIMSSATAFAMLLLLGGTAAWAGGASVVRGAARVAFWGAFAMALTSVVGSLFGANVS